MSLFSKITECLWVYLQELTPAVHQHTAFAFIIKQRGDHKGKKHSVNTGKLNGYFITTAEVL